MDYIVRATDYKKEVRAFAITSRELVEKARETHNTSPVATAALGRLLTGGAMMGIMLKGDDELLTLKMKGDGKINGVTVIANSEGRVKGFVGNPSIMLPPNYAGKLDVGAAIGYGELTVIKDLGLKEPYISKVPLGTSEVAEDLTYYFAVSEQIPSAVGLGVLMSKDNHVREAGGFIVQIMPGASEETIKTIEENVAKITSVTDILKEGKTPEDLLDIILGDLGVDVIDKVTPRFECDCSKERIMRAIATLNKKDLDEIIADGESIEVKCDFCNTKYDITVEELLRLQN